MSKSYAVLPCNGLDKAAGCLSREMALELVKASPSEIICPVLYQEIPGRYEKPLANKPLLVIDGCATRCATKLAEKHHLKIAAKVLVLDQVKEKGRVLPNDLQLGEAQRQLAEEIAADWLTQLDMADAPIESIAAHMDFPAEITYETYQKDKFIFRVPTQGFYFNENDCWVYVNGNIARVGVTDFVQQSLSDIIFFVPPKVGESIDQFGELGSVEAGKAVFEVVSPVSGKVLAVNPLLADHPELINQNPYEKGWIADLELSDWEGDKELLQDFAGYFEILKGKVDHFNV